jgi:hypothetical protein
MPRCGCASTPPASTSTHPASPYPDGWVFMTVDNHGFLVDLSKIEGTLVDPTISAVTWGPELDGADMRDGGCIIRQDGTKQLFWDDALLKPYLYAWRLRRQELLGCRHDPSSAPHL